MYIWFFFILIWKKNNIGLGSYTDLFMYLSKGYSVEEFSRDDYYIKNNYFKQFLSCIDISDIQQGQQVSHIFEECSKQLNNL
jgi:hypothetical protein